MCVCVVVCDCVLRGSEEARKRGSHAGSAGVTHPWGAGVTAKRRTHTHTETHAYNHTHTHAQRARACTASQKHGRTRPGHPSRVRGVLPHVRVRASPLGPGVCIALQHTHTEASDLRAGLGRPSERQATRARITHTKRHTDGARARSHTHTHTHNDVAASQCTQADTHKASAAQMACEDTTTGDLKKGAWLAEVRTTHTHVHGARLATSLATQALRAPSRKYQIDVHSPAVS